MVCEWPTSLGLVLGWRLLRRLLPPKRRAVANTLQADDFLTWATLGIVLGGRIGYVLFYQPGLYIRHDPLAALEGLAGRHELPWRHAGHRSSPSSSSAGGKRIPILGFADRHRQSARRSGSASAASLISSTVSCGAAPHRQLAALGDDLPADPTRWAPPPSRAIRASSTRRMMEGLILFVLLLSALPATRRSAPVSACSPVHLPGSATAVARMHRRTVPPAGSAQLGYLCGSAPPWANSSALPMLLGGLVLVWNAFRRPPCG